MFTCSGILFNHESPRRGKEFVTQKIATAAKNRERVALGNLDAKRDWGFAGDYVRAMWLMLQQPSPDDFVIATGITHSVRDFAELAYRCKGLNYLDYVIVDQDLFRPNELHVLKGDPRKDEFVLNCKPNVTFSQLVEMMVCS